MIADSVEHKNQKSVIDFIDKQTGLEPITPDK